MYHLSTRLLSRLLSSHSSDLRSSYFSFFFFFNATATPEIYTLSLHDALPILIEFRNNQRPAAAFDRIFLKLLVEHHEEKLRSEEHTSELQSRQYLVCRLLLEKKKKKKKRSKISRVST